ncbi:MAG: polysaccharide deacetylase family protein, partial [Actinobacteria bacterium]|nr:polysaccharide deacetylase family protein [Actinomycetota bacterium]
LDDADATVPDGSYTVSAMANDGSDPVVASTQVTVDTRAPRFVWRAISPEPIMSARPFHLRFVTGDAEKHLDATVILFDASGELRRSEGLAVGSGRVSLEQRPRYKDGRPWLPGLYRAQIVLTDEAGNRTRSPIRAFRSHRSVKTRVIHRLSGVGPRVALTFDDCGDGVAWKRILHILADRHAKASFFCLGPYVTRYKAQARRTVADGHTIGSHSMNHALETGLSYSEILRQNRGPQAAWWKVAHVTPAPYFRPPYGAYDSEVLRAVGDAGYANTVIWDVDPRDWERPGPAVIANRVLATARSGSIVVMHALKGTAAALPAIITRLRAKGLEPVSLQEMFDRARTRRPTDAGPVLSHPFE